MPRSRNPETPEERELLVAFSDLTEFTRVTAELPAPRVFQLMNSYFELVGDLVEEAGGTVVKCIGDAFLAVFPANRAERGVRALHRLREEGDRWFEERKLGCRHRIRAHFGPVACGPFGTRSAKRFDVYGMTVNAAARTPSDGLALTEAAFRLLSPATRKLFRRRAPPAFYAAKGPGRGPR